MQVLCRICEVFQQNLDVLFNDILLLQLDEHNIILLLEEVQKVMILLIIQLYMLNGDVQL